MEVKKEKGDSDSVCVCKNWTTTIVDLKVT